MLSILFLLPPLPILVAERQLPGESVLVQVALGESVQAQQFLYIREIIINDSR